MKKSLSLVLAALMIAAAFVFAAPAAAGGSGFSDVAAGRWSYGSVLYVVREGYMSGTGGGKFSPADPLTRAMVATVLWRRQGSPAPSAPSGFSDVPDGKWYADAVAWAKETGVVQGVSETKFKPESNVTREQLAAMLFRFSETCPVSVPERADLGAFPDGAKVSGWATEAMSWAVRSALIKGKDNGSLDPAGNATREQFAAIMERFDSTFRLKFNSPVLTSHYTEPEYPLVGDADFYVSPDGDDAAAGDFGHPFRTWERARDAVRALDKAGRDGITVAFFAGEYGALTLSLTEEDAGTEECPVTYCKYGDGDVIFRNGVKIKESDFTGISDADRPLFPEKATGSIRKVNVREKYGIAEFSDKNELFDGEQRCVAARFPNQIKTGENIYIGLGFRNVGDWQDRIEIANQSVARRVSGYHTFDGVKVIGQLGYEWWTDTLEVESYDPETKILKFTTNAGLIDQNFDRNTYMFHNVSEELDHENEYWFDPSSGDLFVYAPKGDYTLSTEGTFFTASGADFVRIVGMKFLCTTGGAFSVNADDFTIDRCVFFGTGAKNGSQLEGSRDRLTRCEFRHLAGHGVTVSGGDETYLIPSENVVDNCLFSDFSQVYRSATEAIGCYGVGNTISHCEFTNSPYIGIMYHGKNHLIEYCVFRDLVLEGGDLGFVYTGRSHVARGTVIRRNFFDNNASQGFAIYLDDGIDGQSVYGNFFNNTYPFSNGGRDIYMCDNVLLDPWPGGHGITMGAKYYTTAVEAAAAGADLPDWLGTYAPRHETLFDKPEEGEEGYAEWLAAFPELYEIIPGYADLTDPRTEVCPTGCTVRRNYSFGPKAAIHVSDGLVFSDVGDNVDVTGLDENPIFVNPTVGDYRIKPGCGFFDIEIEKMGRY